MAKQLKESERKTEGSNKIKVRSATYANDFELLDWLKAHPQNKSQTISPTAPNFSHFKNSFWPDTNEYFNPFNSIFLAQVISLEQFNVQPKWFVRDGLIPLMWFFKNHPSPKGIRSQLIIDVRWANFVPRAWLANVKFYELICSPETDKYERLMLFGSLMSQTVDIEQFSVKAEKLKDDTGVTVFQKDPIGFLVTRFTSNGDDQAFHVEASFALARYFGVKVQFSTWAQLLEVNSFSGVYAIGINDFSIISDTDIAHRILSRGGYVQGIRKVKKFGPNDVQLSPFHGFSILRKPSKEISIEKSKAFLFEALNSEANLQFPWPNWFGKWGNANA